jgi:hypothetical protein
MTRGCPGRGGRGREGATGRGRGRGPVNPVGVLEGAGVEPPNQVNSVGVLEGAAAVGVLEGANLRRVPEKQKARKSSMRKKMPRQGRGEVQHFLVKCSDHGSEPVSGGGT